MIKKYVCPDCAGSSEIARNVFSENTKVRKTCSYCSTRKGCIDIDLLAEAVDQNYRGEYVFSDEGDSPSEIISELLELDSSAGKLDADLVEILHNNELHNGSEGIDPIYDESLTYLDFGLFQGGSGRFS